MGSLIKNPGGTIVTGGGYVAGKASLVAAAQARLTAPGVGIDAGSVPGETVRLMMQGTSAILAHAWWNGLSLACAREVCSLEGHCALRCKVELLSLLTPNGSLGGGF